MDDLDLATQSIAEEGRVAAPVGPTATADVGLHGLANVRGEKRVPLSSINEGRFGRMFRRLSPLVPLEDAALEDLANRMREPQAPAGWNGAVQDFDNPAIPAGFTYLGQFIDHDITFDTTSSLDRQNDPDALHDFRSPRFDLDSLYGSGPVDEPFQYRRASDGLEVLIGANENGDPDLPRNADGVAVIGDPRNDENTIVGQLQLAFLDLHNRIGAIVRDDPMVPVTDKFTEAQRRVRWLYQWIVAKDFVPRIIGSTNFARIFQTEPDGRVNIVRPHFEPRTMPFMPVEFSVAAFRYGHSQVRGIYNLSEDVTDRPIFVPGPLQDPTQDLRGFRPLPGSWTVDWHMFFNVAGSIPQPSRKIDAKLSQALFDLPDGGRSLAFRNLKRGQALGLPSGQAVAEFMGEDVLTSADLDGAPEPTPLWFYILREAEVRHGGEHLGGVGGRIVGEVLLGLLELDRQSWLWGNPRWSPDPMFDVDGDGEVTIGDLLMFAQPPPQAG
jgi:heme peroxidase